MTPAAQAKAPTRPLVRPSIFTGVKVFGATVSSRRGELGDTVTKWLAAHPEIAPVDIVVAQSSDSQFHCLSICVFYTGELAAVARASSPPGAQV